MSEDIEADRKKRIEELEAMNKDILSPSELLDWMVEHNQCMGLYDE